jgi:Zn-finger nucleic acid-binding protein
LAPYRDDTSVFALCPRCGGETPLRELAHLAARALACPACGGIFASREVLEHLASVGADDLCALSDEAARVPPTTPSDVPDLPCPRCGTALRRVRLTRASCEIDVCAFHGAWFDRWEGRTIARALADPAVQATLRRVLRGTD